MAFSIEQSITRTPEARLTLLVGASAIRCSKHETIQDNRTFTSTLSESGRSFRGLMWTWFGSLNKLRTFRQDAGTSLAWIRRLQVL